MSEIGYKVRHYVLYKLLLQAAECSEVTDGLRGLR